MVHFIMESICISLDAEFGDGYKIYREETEQGLQGPCFFVLCCGVKERPFPNKRYFRESQFCIRYLPGGENEECHAAAERLLWCLKWLEVQGDPVMGTKMRYEVSDGVLRFFVNYDMFVYREAESVPWMEEISSSTSVKGEMTG